MQSQHNSIDLTNTSNGITKKKPTRTTHVPTACINCKKAHLACDLSRPCKRCSSLGKSDSCIDIKHKKRGRPKLSSVKKWHPTTASSTGTLSSKQLTQHLSFPLANPPALIPSRSITASSFKLTASKERHSNEDDHLPIEMMTLFLSMDLCCARVSDESIQFLDIDPNQLGHCSLYGLIHPESSEALSRLHRILLDNCHHHVTQPISFTPASSETFLTASPAQLLTIANGSQTIRETLKFKANCGSRLECQFYLGGGFGGDLFTPTTLNQLYMVCVVSRRNNEINRQTPLNAVESILANDMAASDDYQALFDDPALLSLYNSTTTNDNEAIQLVNHLCEAIISPTSTIDTLYTASNDYSGSSGSSSCGSVEDGSSKRHSTSSISSSRSSSISERVQNVTYPQPTFEQASVLDDFMLSAQKHSSTPMSELLAGDLLNDNNAYWLG